MSNIHLFSNLEFSLNDVGLHSREVAYRNPKPLPLKYYFNGFCKSLAHSTLDSFKSRVDFFPRLKSFLFDLKSFLKKLADK